MLTGGWVLLLGEFSVLLNTVMGFVGQDEGGGGKNLVTEGRGSPSFGMLRGENLR